MLPVDVPALDEREVVLKVQLYDKPKASVSAWNWIMQAGKLPEGHATALSHLYAGAMSSMHTRIREP